MAEDELFRILGNNPDKSIVGIVKKHCDRSGMTTELLLYYVLQKLQQNHFTYGTANTTGDGAVNKSTFFHEIGNMMQQLGQEDMPVSLLASIELLFRFHLAEDTKGAKTLKSKIHEQSAKADKAIGLILGELINLAERSQLKMRMMLDDMAAGREIKPDDDDD